MFSSTVNGRVLPHALLVTADTKFQNCIWRKLLNYKTKIYTCHSTTSLKHENSLDSSNSNQSSESDCFGTLRESIEVATDLCKTIDKRKNCKVIHIKRPKFYSSKEKNTFGNLSDSRPIWYPEIQEEFKKDNTLSDDSILVKNISRNYRCPAVYLSRMKDLVKEKKLKDALDLFVDMRKNFIEVKHAHFTFMIGACGRAGYTEMAFKLLRQMTDRKLCPTPATLTGLFNSCAESPFPEYGLKKAQGLKEKIQIKNWKLTQLTYHAMIKAFGRCGDIKTAFALVDEMAKNDIKIDHETYNFLLMSCISDKEVGFTYAVEVWRKMIARRVTPELTSFNLLLRAARDCGIGPEDISCLLLQHWSSYLKRPYGLGSLKPVEKVPMLQLSSSENIGVGASSSGSNQDDDEQTHEKAMKENHFSVMPINTRNDIVEIKATMSILAERPLAEAYVIDLVNIKRPADRLSLIGNMKGILQEISTAKLRPNIKTFTLILECLPENTEAEQELLDLMESYNLNPDMGFFNILIKRRSFRHDYSGAHAAFVLASKWSLSPDIITFGVLALGCQTFKRANIFLRDMMKLGFCPNVNIVGSLLSNACEAVDFDYMKMVLELMKKESIELNEKVLKKLESSVQNIRQTIIDMEHNRNVPSIYREEGFANKYKNFIEYYEEWLKNTSFKNEPHIWNQFKTDIYNKENVTE